MNTPNGVPAFVLEILHPIPSHVSDQNVDVVVRLEGGKAFGATFFTLENIELLLRRFNETGECLAGRYFWAVNMIIVKELTERSIRATVEDLLATGEFESAFRSSRQSRNGNLSGIETGFAEVDMNEHGNKAGSASQCRITNSNIDT